MCFWPLLKDLKVCQLSSHNPSWRQLAGAENCCSLQTGGVLSVTLSPPLPLVESWFSLFTHITCLDPVVIWVQVPEARWLLKPLPVPIVYWISIRFMTLSTKIKAKILSLKSSSWVYEHLSHKRSAHIKCWSQELFSHEQRCVKPPAKQTGFCSNECYADLHGNHQDCPPNPFVPSSPLGTR